MKRLVPIVVALTLLWVGAVAAPAAPRPAGPQTAPVIHLKTCGSGYVRAVIGGEQKCLHSGQFCARSRVREYRRYRFVCKPGSDGRYRLFRR